jgi:uncharacterized protein GlcG (DUF336 family)
MTLKLSAAQAIVEHALQHARSLKFRPLSIAVLDSRSAVIAAASEDGTSLKRFQVAHGKARRALALHGGSAPAWSNGGGTATFITGAVGGAGLMPVAGGVLIRSAAGEVLVAVGISGDNSNSDEACAIAGIMAASLLADGG